MAPYRRVNLLMVGSIYNMGLWDERAALVNLVNWQTWDGEATARQSYKETGHILGNGRGV